MYLWWDWCQLHPPPPHADWYLQCFHSGRVRGSLALGPSGSSSEAGSGSAEADKGERRETACRYPAASTQTHTLPLTRTPFTPQAADAGESATGCGAIRRLDWWKGENIFNVILFKIVVVWIPEWASWDDIGGVGVRRELFELFRRAFEQVDCE